MSLRCFRKLVMADGDVVVPRAQSWTDLLDQFPAGGNLGQNCKTTSSVPLPAPVPTPSSGSANLGRRDANSSGSAVLLDTRNELTQSFREKLKSQHVAGTKSIEGGIRSMRDEHSDHVAMTYNPGEGTPRGSSSRKGSPTGATTALAGLVRPSDSPSSRRGASPAIAGGNFGQSSS